MFEPEATEVGRNVMGRHVMGPNDLLVIRVRSGTTQEQAESMKAFIDADGRLKDRFLILPAEQLVIVRSDEAVANVA